MRTETLAIVFTDIKGYTAATSKQSHQENARMLRRIERLVAPVVKAFAGRVVKSIGDAYMMAFRSPTEAVRCASAIQDRLHQHNTSARADQGIHIRIAINAGEVRVHRGDVFGDPVNIAARIESVTPADEIYLSQAVYLTMNRSEVMAEPVGDYDLKGIAEAVRVYRIKKSSEIAVEESDEKKASPRAAGLPYGGTDLGYWRRIRWLRWAYRAIWALAVIGVLGGAYIRYRPQKDFGDVVGKMKVALDAEGDQPVDPMVVLALAGQIPPSALVEYQAARRYRRQAVAHLIVSEDPSDVQTAADELERLLSEDPRDAEALMLRGEVRIEQGVEINQAVESLAAALKIDNSLADNEQLAQAVVAGYADPQARRLADRLVMENVKDRAIPALKRALSERLGDRVSQNMIAARLQQLGAGAEVDWVELAIQDLKAGSCKVRKAAIAKLLKEKDQRAVGPLIKLAESKECGASNAKQAVKILLKK